MTDKKTEKICIFTDSASDITHEEAERWDVKVAPLGFTAVRWVVETPKELNRLRLPSTALIAKDRDERDVILFESEWSIEWALDNNPGLKLTDTAAR